MTEFFQEYFVMALEASIVILIVFAVRPFIKRFSNRIMCLLWLVVLFRLLCPFTVQGPIPAFWNDWMAESETNPVQENAVGKVSVGKAEFVSHEENEALIKNGERQDGNPAGVKKDVVTSDGGDILGKDNQKSDLTGKNDAVGKADVAGKADVVGKTDVAGKADVVGTTDVAGKADVAGKTDVAGKADVVGTTDVAGKADVVGKADGAGKADVVGKTGGVGKADAIGKKDGIEKADVQEKDDVTEEKRWQGETEENSPKKSVFGYLGKVWFP